MVNQQLENAIAWANQLHAGQKRDGDSPLPYITHCIEVLENLRYVGQVTDQEMWIAAVLHDVLESTNTTSQEVADRFGTDVCRLVEELTRREPSPEETKDLSKEEIWSLRSSIMLDEIAHMSPKAQTIKLADRLSNLIQADQTKKGDKLRRYRKQTKQILEIVPRSVNSKLHDEISRRLKTE